MMIQAPDSSVIFRNTDNHSFRRLPENVTPVRPPSPSLYVKSSAAYVKSSAASAVTGGGNERNGGSRDPLRCFDARTDRLDCPRQPRVRYIHAHDCARLCSGERDQMHTVVSAQPEIGNQEIRGGHADVFARGLKIAARRHFGDERQGPLQREPAPDIGFDDQDSCCHSSWAISQEGSHSSCVLHTT
jgi:hypothetical protein